MEKTRFYQTILNNGEMFLKLALKKRTLIYILLLLFVYQSQESVSMGNLKGRQRLENKTTKSRLAQN